MLKIYFNEKYSKHPEEKQLALHVLITDAQGNDANVTSVT
jgi:hypothetical protein